MRRLLEILVTGVSVIVAVSAARFCRGAENRAESLQGELIEIRLLLDGQTGAVQTSASGEQEDDRALENGVRAFLRRQVSALDAATDAMEDYEGGEQPEGSAERVEALAVVHRTREEATIHAERWQPVFSELEDLAGRVASTLGDDAMENDDVSAELRVLREDMDRGVAGIALEVESSPSPTPRPRR